MNFSNGIDRISIHTLYKVFENFSKTIEDFDDDMKRLEKKFEKLPVGFFENYVDSVLIDISVKNIQISSKLTSGNIEYIYPMSSLYVLLYIRNKFEQFNEAFVCVTQNKNSHERLQKKEYLSFVTNFILFSKKEKLDIKKLDEKLLRNEKITKGSRKSSTGSLFKVQTSKFFKVKYNREINQYLPMDILKGTTAKHKNYLIPKKDEIIVIQCPKCKKKMNFFYECIDEYFKLKDNCVELICNHQGNFTEPVMIDIKPYNISSDTNKNIYMFIVNNRKIFGLQVPKNKTSS